MNSKLPLFNRRRRRRNFLEICHFLAADAIVGFKRTVIFYACLTHAVYMGYLNPTKNNYKNSVFLKSFKK